MKNKNSLNTQDPYINLEQIKKVFLLANQSKKDFLKANDLRKNKKLEILLWNLKINNQNVAEVAFKTPYQRMAETPKNATFETMLALWHDVGIYLVRNKVELIAI